MADPNKTPSPDPAVDASEDSLRSIAKEAWSRVPNMRGEQSGKPLTTGEATTLGGIAAMSVKAAAGAAKAAEPAIRRVMDAAKTALPRATGGGPPTGAGPWEPPGGGAGGVLMLTVLPKWAQHYIETGETTGGGDTTL